MRRLLSLPLLVLAGLAVFGCETAPQTRGGQPITEPVRSVVSLSPSSTEILASINYNRILTGRTESDNFPISVSSVPVVASVKPNYEKIAAIKPQLVLYDELLYSKDDIKKITDLGAKTFAFNANTVDEFTKQIYRLGALVNSESNASSYVDKILAAKSTAQAQSLSRNPKVAVVLVGDGTEHMVVGTKSFLADVIRSAGGEPVGPDSDRFVSLSPESFVASNPEMIVIAYPVFSKNEDLTRDGAIKRAKKIVNDPRLKSVLAVQKELILPVDEDILTRRGYRVDRLIEEISRRIQAVAQQ